MPVSVVETTVTGVGDTPVPGSKSTTTGARKFVPVMVMIWPPAGLPMDGVTPLMVGAVEGGGGVTVLSTKRTEVLLVTLLTVAVIVAITAVLEKIEIEGPPLVGVLMAVFTSGLAPWTNGPASVPKPTGGPFGNGGPPRLTLPPMTGLGRTPVAGQEAL